MPKGELEAAFWNEGLASYVVGETIELASQRTYAVDERTGCFGEAIIDFANIIPRTPVPRPLIEQLVGCGTSVARIIARLTMQCQKRNFDFVAERAKRKRVKRNTSCG